MNALRRLSLFASLTGIIFLTEAVAAAAIIGLSDFGWESTLWVLAIPLSLAVMVVSAALAALLTLSIARRVMLAGFSPRLEELETARSESHRHLATANAAMKTLVGSLETQRQILTALRAQLAPAAEKLAQESGPARAARPSLFNAISLTSSLLREADLRLNSVRETQSRLSRVSQVQADMLHPIREAQELFDSVPAMTMHRAEELAQQGSVLQPMTLAEAKLLAEALLREDKKAQPAPAAPIVAADEIPPALRARIGQGSLGTGSEGYDLGLN